MPVNNDEIELTQTNGKRFAVRAFAIAGVLEKDNSTEVTYNNKTVEVRESYDDVQTAKQRALETKPPVKAPVARKPVGFKNYS